MCAASRSTIRSARDAMRARHRDHPPGHLARRPTSSIARNLFLGREPVTARRSSASFAPLDFARTAAGEPPRCCSGVGISKELDADAPVSTLSGGERQSIAISRAMQFAAKVIILDEPTNNLGVEETHGVLRFVKEMRDAGHRVLFITHNIHHVFEVADRIIVMRRGEVMAELIVAETDLLTVESADHRRRCGEADARGQAARRE